MNALGVFLASFCNVVWHLDAFHLKSPAIRHSQLLQRRWRGFITTTKQRCSLIVIDSSPFPGDVTCFATTASSSLDHDPESSDVSSSSASRFGRQDYWDNFYRESKDAFSWYTGFSDLEPFLRELMSPSDHILIPGVGNDAMLLDMYQHGGYHHLTAFDYAPEGIAQCRQMLEQEGILVSMPHDKGSGVTSHGGSKNTNKDNSGVTLFVVDATDLSQQLQDESFDAVLEKGTLDAIIQSGDGTDKDPKSSGRNNMEMAITELTRVLKPGGIFISVSAICTDALQASPIWENDNIWEVVRDESLYFTEDGYASNNFDGILLAWRKKQ